MGKLTTNWGNYPKIDAKEFNFTSNEELLNVLQQTNNIIARGSGYCYGDASLNPNIIAMKSYNKIIQFDTKQGIITCQAGATLEEILNVIVPQGWFLPVTPGTKYITIGGAVASDVHGKNHHVDGCFSRHIISCDILTGNQEVKTCNTAENAELFDLTCGGMGLTGVILQVTFSLKKIETSYIKQRDIKARNLDEVFALFEENKDTTYSVAWIDCLQSGKKLGRSILMLGEHAEQNDLVKPKKNALKIFGKKKMNVPIYFPSFTLNNLTVRLFNFMYYNKMRKKELNYINNYDSFFYPLDKVLNWNRIYGRRGFLQYQFVIPLENSKKGLTTILNRINQENAGSFLAVLKLLGPGERLLSFEMEGMNLALDFPIKKGIFEFLDELDKIIVDLGGRHYLTKDARMKAEIFAQGYPAAESFKEKLSKYNPGNTFRSLQSDRLEITTPKLEKPKVTMNTILILGANSDVAKALATQYAAQGKNLILASINSTALEPFVKELKANNNTDIELHEFDALKYDTHPAFINNLKNKPDTAVCAFGYLGNHDKAINNWEESKAILEINYLGAVSILNAVANYFEACKAGIIVGISSVAGDRGRQSNYYYGSAKAGFTTYLSGLRNRLQKSGVHVVTVKPGFINSKMTAGIDLPKPLTAQPDKVAKAIIRAVRKKKNTLYILSVWRLIMCIIRTIPEGIFKRLSL